MTTLFGRILLGASALTFLAYGGISLYSPTIPAGIAGIEIISGDGFAEVSGMYGGLQTGIGLFCLLAFSKHAYYRPGLIILGLTMISLAIARLSGMLLTPVPVTLYSYGALAFEFVVAALAFSHFLGCPMTQHEYIFIAVSIILGLAITRLLRTAAAIVRARDRVTFHWSSGLWAFSVMLYILQLWWIGWGLRVIEDWTFLDFILVFGSSCLYGAAEMALTSPEGATLDMLQESQNLGRLSALSMLLYFFVGPYVNIIMYNNDAVIPSLVVPSLGIGLMALVISAPSASHCGRCSF